MIREERTITIGQERGMRGQPAAQTLLPVTQSNASGNLWTLETALVATTAENTTLAFDVAYAQAEGGILLDASAIFPGAELGAVVWPSGNQITPGQLPPGRRVHLNFDPNDFSPNFAKWVVSTPGEPVEAETPYEARRAFYTARNIQIASAG